MNSKKFVYIWLLLSLICVIGFQLVFLEVSHASKLCDLKIDRVTPDKGAFTVSNIGTYTNKKTKALIWIKYENGTIYKKLVNIKAILPGRSVYYKNQYKINGPMKNALIRVNPYQSQRELNFSNNVVFFKKKSIAYFLSENLSPVNIYEYFYVTEFYPGGIRSEDCSGIPFIDYTSVISSPIDHWTNGDINGTESIRSIKIYLGLINTVSKVSLKLRYEPLLIIKLNNGLGKEVDFSWNSSSQAYEINQDLNVSNPWITCINLAPDLNDSSPLDGQNFCVNKTIFAYKKTKLIVPGSNVDSWIFS